MRVWISIPTYVVPRVAETCKTYGGDVGIDFEEVAMSLATGVALDIVRVDHLGRYRLELTFSDGHVSTVDFGPFLRVSPNPETRRFLDEEHFKGFSLTHGNLVWGTMKCVFPSRTFMKAGSARKNSSVKSLPWRRSGPNTSQRGKRVKTVLFESRFV